MGDRTNARIPAVNENVEHPHQEFFEPWREARRERYAQPRPGGLRERRRPRRRRRAVLTIAHDEAEYERWFYEDSGFEDAGIHIVLEPIPASWRSLS